MVRGAGSRKGKESDMYTFDSRVRYSETDEEGNLSVVGIRIVRRSSRRI